MRKAFIGLLILLLCSLVYSAYGATSVSGRPCPGGVVASCETAVTTQDTGGGTSGKFTNGTVYKIAQEFVAAKDYCLCKITVYLKIVGTPTGTMSLKIYSHGATYPNTLLGTATETKVAGDLTTSMAAYTFTFSSCISLTNTTAYFVVTEGTDLGDTSNYFQVDYLNTGTNELAYYTTSWGSGDSSATARIITYE